jgi:hypothetical protein
MHNTGRGWASTAVTPYGVISVVTATQQHPGYALGRRAASSRTQISTSAMHSLLRVEQRIQLRAHEPAVAGRPGRMRTCKHC